MTLADDKKSKVLAMGANSIDDAVAVEGDAGAMLLTGTRFIFIVVVPAPWVFVDVDVDDSRRPEENRRSVAEDRASAKRPVSPPRLPFRPLLLL